MLPLFPPLSLCVTPPPYTALHRAAMVGELHRPSLARHHTTPSTSSLTRTSTCTTQRTQSASPALSHDAAPPRRASTCRHCRRSPSPSVASSPTNAASPLEPRPLTHWSPRGTTPPAYRASASSGSFPCSATASGRRRHPPSPPRLPSLTQHVGSAITPSPPCRSTHRPSWPTCQ